jgi:hypothetical protein
MKREKEEQLRLRATEMVRTQMAHTPTTGNAASSLNPGRQGRFELALDPDTQQLEVVPEFELLLDDEACEPVLPELPLMSSEMPS